MAKSKDTQRLFVINKLLKTGYITRNECLQNYISRLSDIIFKLKKIGFEFETEKVKNNSNFETVGDFKYIATHIPDSYREVA